MATPNALATISLFSPTIISLQPYLFDFQTNAWFSEQAYARVHLFNSCCPVLIFVFSASMQNAFDNLFKNVLNLGALDWLIEKFFFKY